jgi:hypothetical protein
VAANVNTERRELSFTKELLYACNIPNLDHVPNRMVILKHRIRPKGPLDATPSLRIAKVNTAGEEGWYEDPSIFVPGTIIHGRVFITIAGGRRAEVFSDDHCPKWGLDLDMVDRVFELDLDAFDFSLVQALLCSKSSRQIWPELVGGPFRRRTSSWLMVVVIWFVAMTWVNKFPILFECIALHPLSNFETHDEQPYTHVKFVVIVKLSKLTASCIWRSNSSISFFLHDRRKQAKVFSVLFLLQWTSSRRPQC